MTSHTPPSAPRERIYTNSGERLPLDRDAVFTDIAGQIDYGSIRGACELTGKVLGLSDFSNTLPPDSAVREVPDMDAQAKAFVQDKANLRGFNAVYHGRSVDVSYTPSNTLDRLKENDQYGNFGTEIAQFIVGQNQAKAKEAILRVGRFEQSQDPENYWIRVYTPNGKVMEVHNARKQDTIENLIKNGYAEQVAGRVSDAPIVASYRHHAELSTTSSSPYRNELGSYLYVELLESAARVPLGAIALHPTAKFPYVDGPK